MISHSHLKNDPTSWLLEADDPGVRYLALRDLLKLTDGDPELVEARLLAHRQGPIHNILEQMQPEGYWYKPGAGYLPKYSSTVWSVILLAQLGAHISQDDRIGRACSYLLDHALAQGGKFSINGAPSGTIDCLQGNLCWAMQELDCQDDRLEAAFEWMARTVTGEGLAPNNDKHAENRYYAYKCGPNFACGANYTLPCAWGAAKVMLAFAGMPVPKRTPFINMAIQQGVDFIFSTEVEKAEWPSGGADKPSSNWWKFGFPVFYVTDLLQVAEALVKLGYGGDPRLAGTLALIDAKQDGQGRWQLEYDYRGKTWVEFGKKKEANKWVTLRAMRVLRGAGG